MKKTKKQIEKFIFFFLLIFFISLILGGSVSAEELKKPLGQSSISPPIINLSLKSGGSVKSSFTYFNNSDSDQVISLDLRPFIPSNGEKGSPIFTDNNGKLIDSPLKDWIKLDKTSYTVLANQKAEINFSVNVPSDNIQAKKYYVAIVAAEKKDNKEIKGSAINTEIGVLIVADVVEFALPIAANKSGSRPWYFYAMVVIFILAIIKFIIIYIRRD